jgi:hypothetical protein
MLLPERTTARVEPVERRDGTISIAFPPTADVREVLTYYERLTGKRIVASIQVIGPLPLVINKPVSREEAAIAIEQALFANGFPVVDLDANHRSDPRDWTKPFQCSHSGLFEARGPAAPARER